MILLFYCIIGVIAGLSAGLLGVGGGIIVVPALAWVFSQSHLPQSAIMHMAAGTSLAVMIITTLASTYSHQRHGAVMWSLVARFVPGLLFGVAAGAATANFLSTSILKMVFAIFLFIISIRMLILTKPKPQHSLPGNKFLSFIGFLVGGNSGLLGVGGGMITVPYLVRCNVLMRNAVASSAAISFIISIVGTILFALIGEHGIQNNVRYSSGYVYWPAFFGVASCSVIFAPVGAWLSHRLPTMILKRMFGLFLLTISIYMLIP